ncbi:MAG: TolC family protein [Bacteroidia bacterium]|nr:TolC family protein [Bacteroidia bacterium]
MKRNLVLGVGLILSVVLQAQTPQPLSPLSLSHYLQKVSLGNLTYAAEKLNTSQAQAEVVAARVFNDPEISVEYADNQDQKLRMGRSVEVGLSQTVTLGKRTAGIRLAKSQAELAETLLADFFRHLRADAAIVYFDVQKQQALYDVKKNSCQNLCHLAQSDSIRFKTGKIMEIEATQSQLEAGILFNELLQAKSDLNNSFSALSLMMGKSCVDTLYVPKGSLDSTERSFTLDHLLTSAVEHRADVVAALKNTEVAHRAVSLARKEKIPDLTLSLALGHNFRVRNEEAPAPNFNSITGGISFPLTFSGLNKGTMQAAKLKVRQAELYYAQARLQVQTEVMQAYQHYQSLFTQLTHFKCDMLQQAQTVLKGKIYSYDRGEVPLLELLNAQRTYDEVQAQYIETLYQYNVALVELERAAGIWTFE